MVGRAVVLALGAVMALPAGAMAAEGDVIATGTILAGGPHTELQSASGLGVDGVDGFTFDLPAGVTKIESRTTDNSGFGYDIDFYFYDADGAYLADTECVVVGEDEFECQVPAGAASVETVAWIGFDLAVQVIDKTPPPPEEEPPPTP